MDKDGHIEVAFSLYPVQKYNVVKHVVCPAKLLSGQAPSPEVAG